MQKIQSIFKPLFFIGVIFVICSIWILKNIRPMELINDIVKEKSTEAETQIKKTEITKVEKEETGINVEDLEISVVNKDIVRKISEDSFEVLVKGEDLEGVESIIDLKLSPNGNKLCFLVETIVPIWLYTYDLETKEVEKIDVGKNCVWSPEGRYIAYNNHVTDVSPINVLIYDTEEKSIRNLSEKLVSTENFLQCQEISWLDERHVSASFKELNFNDVTIDYGENRNIIFDIEGNIKDTI